MSARTVPPVIAVGWPVQTCQKFGPLVLNRVQFGNRSLVLRTRGTVVRAYFLIVGRRNCGSQSGRGLVSVRGSDQSSTNDSSACLTFYGGTIRAAQHRNAQVVDRWIFALAPQELVPESGNAGGMWRRLAGAAHGRKAAARSGRQDPDARRADLGKRVAERRYGKC